VAPRLMDVRLMDVDFSGRALGLPDE
jgi:hypothetical protein